MKEYLKPELGVYSLRSEERFAETCVASKDRPEGIWGLDPSVGDDGLPLYPKWTTPAKGYEGATCQFQNQWIRLPQYIDR